MSRYIEIDKTWLYDSEEDELYDIDTDKGTAFKSKKMTYDKIWRFMPYSKITGEYDKLPYVIV